MPLNLPGLVADIIAAEQAASGEDSVEAARLKFATELATAIDTYVRTGTVTTTGTAAAQTGLIT